MKKMNEYKIDHIAQTITLTKKFAKAAGILGTPEYKKFKELRADHEGYAIQVREIAKKENKTSHTNLTYDFMKTFFITVEGKSTENIAKLEKVIELSHGHPGHYAYVKKWFLNLYPNYQDVLAIAAKIA